MVDLADQPLRPDEQPVGVAVDRLLAQGGLDRRGYQQPSFHVPLGPLRLRFANPGLLPWHDIHHVLTGYGNDFWGEVGISAYELRGGGCTPPVALLCLGALALGLLADPRWTAAAWRRAARCRSLYRRRPHPALLDRCQVGRLRRALRIPAQGLRPTCAPCPWWHRSDRRSPPGVEDDRSGSTICSGMTCKP